MPVSGAVKSCTDGSYSIAVGFHLLVLPQRHLVPGRVYLPRETLLQDFAVVARWSAGVGPCAGEGGCGGFMGKGRRNNPDTALKSSRSCRSRDVTYRPRSTQSWLLPPLHSCLRVNVVDGSAGASTAFSAPYVTCEASSSCPARTHPAPAKLKTPLVVDSAVFITSSSIYQRYQ